ncbi:VWA domain-containing protein [Clostridium sp.]|uniref:VWA domain-containing protein n=2 Tax=unclassified Clostridium TaxID=2614128 RepID=UPI0028A15D40|nr:VWA domain-containing protein [Clostridium sp.]
MDTSGSMNSLYSSGVMQEVVERIFPVALKFDDDKEMEMFIFAGGRYNQELKPLNENNFFGYVSKYIANNVGGGTDYAPVINKIISKYTRKTLFKRKSSETPTFVIFLTDGDNRDKKETKEALIEASKYNIFFKFIGVGNDRFRFLEELDDLQDRERDNANFIKIPNISKISDEELYNKLLIEFREFLETF